jgi:hypothetical protein
LKRSYNGPRTELYRSYNGAMPWLNRSWFGLGKDLSRGLIEEIELHSQS